MALGIGLLQGFNEAAAAERQEVRRRELQRDQQELSILETLARSPDPEIAASAVAGLLAFADPRAKRKGLRGFLGETAGHPALPQIRQLVSQGILQPTTEHRLNVQEGLPSGPPSGEIRSLPGQVGAAAQPQTTPVKGGPVGVPAPQAQAPPTPPSLPVTSGLPYRPGPPPAGPAVTSTPGPTVRRARRVLSSGPYEDRIRGLVEGARAYGAEFTPEETKQLALELAGFSGYGIGGRGAATRFQSVAGELPDGTPAFGVFNPTTGTYTDPQSGQPLPGFRPRTSTGSTSLGADREAISRQLFGKPAAQLTPQEMAQVEQAVIDRTREVSFQRGTGAGEARINTALGMPLDPNQAAQQGIPVGSSLATLQGIVPINADQRERLDAAKALAPQIDDLAALVQRVFPPSSGLVGGLTAEAVLRQKRATRDPELAQLEAAVNLALGNVARVIAAESGRLTEQDAQRARSALVELHGGLLNGDTRESAMAKLQVLQTILARIGQDIRSPGQILGTEQGIPQPGGGPPAAPQPAPSASRNAAPPSGPPPPPGQPPASQTARQPGGGGPPAQPAAAQPTAAPGGVPQATGPGGLFFSTPGPAGSGPAGPDPALATVHTPGSIVVGPDGQLYEVIAILPDGKVRARPAQGPVRAPGGGG